MKITSVRTRVVEWRGKTVPLAPHFCTNPMDLLAQDLGVDDRCVGHGWSAPDDGRWVGFVHAHDDDDAGGCGEGGDGVDGGFDRDQVGEDARQ